MNKFYMVKLFGYYTKNTYQDFIKKINEPGALFIKWQILNMSLMEEKHRKWFIKHILNNLNKKELIYMFMQNLCDELIFNDDEFRRTIMSSFLLTNLIKDIELKNNIYKLTMNNNEIIHFTKLLNTKEDIKKYANRCHEISYNYFKNNANSKNECSVTVLEKGLYKNTRYHTFIVKNNYVYDYARNLIMKYDDYNRLFKPEIISYIDGKEMIQKIDKLDKENTEFTKSKKIKVLKYAIHTKINSFNK